MTYSSIEWADIYFIYEQSKSHRELIDMYISIITERNHFTDIYINLKYLLKKKSLFRKEKIFRIIFIFFLLFFDYT